MISGRNVGHRHASCLGRRWVPAHLSRIMGPCRFVRIMCHGDTVVDMAPGMSTEHESGSHRAPGPPGSSVNIDTWVTIEIGQQ